jgi:hypothetical protein
MVEGEMSEVSEAEMVEAIKFAHEAIKVQCTAQKELEELVGKTEKRTYDHENNDEELKKELYDLFYDKVYFYCFFQVDYIKHEPVLHCIAYSFFVYIVSFLKSLIKTIHLIDFNNNINIPCHPGNRIIIHSN